MRTALTQKGVTDGNTAIYGAALLVSADGGKTWTEATAETFLTDGLQVTLPYPEGTDSSYIFKVAHMFTSDAFGKISGEVEYPEVENTEQGIRFTVTGLSPISLGWTKPSEQKPETKPEPEPVPPVPTTCTGGTDCPSYGFADVGPVGTWYHEAVDYVLKNGLMNGCDNGLFHPDKSLTRGQFAQILYNKAGKPAVKSGSMFRDVDTGRGTRQQLLGRR